MGLYGEPNQTKSETSLFGGLGSISSTSVAAQNMIFSNGLFYTAEPTKSKEKEKNSVKKKKKKRRRKRWSRGPTVLKYHPYIFPSLATVANLKGIDFGTDVVLPVPPIDGAEDCCGTLEIPTGRTGRSQKSEQIHTGLSSVSEGRTEEW
ncbi:hypothetical protein CEXT_611021 [Caerostris extrusa]|uniref:Uncharacterized protein n=1 Tax=Caerostris extrusa TaxID=172846 RepID=A0AAV4M6G3_CAEEX|nr:hypothetical protein CEXT_611021 [Caerostris extrusa]